MTWDQLEHAEDWVLFPENIGEYLSLDEACLSQGELYTVMTNKEANFILYRYHIASSEPIVDAFIRYIHNVLFCNLQFAIRELQIAK